MARKDWTAEDLRRQVSVTYADGRVTDHKAELQLFAMAANEVGAGVKQIDEIIDIANSRENLESRGVKANQDKGQATKRVLEKGYAETRVEVEAIERNREGLRHINLTGTSDKTKEVVSKAKEIMKNADRHRETKKTKKNLGLQ